MIIHRVEKLWVLKVPKIFNFQNPPKFFTQWELLLNSSNSFFSSQFGVINSVIQIFSLFQILSVQCLTSLLPIFFQWSILDVHSFSTNSSFSCFFSPFLLSWQSWNFFSWSSNRKCLIECEWNNRVFWKPTKIRLPSERRFWGKEILKFGKNSKFDVQCGIKW